MTRNEKPATRAGLPVVVCFAGNAKPSTTGAQSQASWAYVRDMERRSCDLTRVGLGMRGSDRFNALALASTYALAARNAARLGVAV